jgi:hypothetical protein
LALFDPDWLQSWGRLSNAVFRSGAPNTAPATARNKHIGCVFMICVSSEMLNDQVRLFFARVMTILPK